MPTDSTSKINNVSTQQPSGYLISAPWRSSGKTVLTMGLAAALRQQQKFVQTFKKGPDYIDPRWLATASGRPCYNLDMHQQSCEEILSTYRRHAAVEQVNLVEGTMGLHDGLASDGSDSNAAIAKLLGLPVILVIDGRGMHRTVAALLLGIQQFDPELCFAGVVLNRVRSDRHAQKIERAIAAHTDLPLLGTQPDSVDLDIAEQELGLTPAPDHANSHSRIEEIAAVVKSHVNTDALFAHVQAARTDGQPIVVASQAAKPRRSLKIGIAFDEAFHFYYQDDLDYLQSQGVELIRCSPCHDTFPVGLDGLWLGGGFPERHAASLSANKRFLSTMRQQIQAGLPVHAECAGLMYLCRSVQVDGARWSMSSVIEADVRLCDRPVGRGYMQLSTVVGNGSALPAHEFHHSCIDFDTQPDFAYRVTRGHGITGREDGVMLYNVIASFAHFRHTQKTPWIDWFLGRVHAYKNNPVYNHV